MPRKPAVLVLTPSIGRGPVESSSMYTPGDRYSGIASLLLHETKGGHDHGAPAFHADRRLGERWTIRQHGRHVDSLIRLVEPEVIAPAPVCGGARGIRKSAHLDL